jgi:hypothetical protein
VIKPIRIRVKPERDTTSQDREKIMQYIDQCVPELHKIGTTRALLGQMGKALALKQKCLQCCGYQRLEVEKCTVITCTLYPVRPYQHDEEGEDDNG